MLQQQRAFHTWLRRARKQSQVDFLFRQVTFHTYTYVCVVVNFLSQVTFVCLLFFGMVIYVNDVETNEK